VSFASIRVMAAASAIVSSVSLSPSTAAVSGVADVGDSYRREIEAFHRHREDQLTSDGGWLSVAGLFWLKPGANRFGSSRSNDVVLPPSAPAHAGTFWLEAGAVRVEAGAGVPLTLAGMPVTRQTLRSDTGGADPDVLALGPLTLQIIERGGRLAVRLKDKDRAERKHFKGLVWYPINPAYRIVARFVPHERPTTITVPSIIGTAEAMPSPGTAVFELGGRSVRLDPVVEAGDDRLFFIFRDKTAGKTTYGAGRFLYADPPKDGRVILDFNQAVSPPCAVTPYATCPLPPPQNRQPIAIEAGEMSAGH
jgi:uncharacterized protein (DUF1684 family)